MKLIPLTQNRFSQVDDQDFEYLNKFKWYSYTSGNNIYAVRAEKQGKKWVVIAMAREIMGCKPGDGLVVDHINRDGLNNQRNNLRTCTKAQNTANKRARGVSKYLGVSYEKNGHGRKRWEATIRTNGKHRRIGRYYTEIEAAEAYNNVAKLQYGEFANLNKI